MSACLYDRMPVCIHVCMLVCLYVDVSLCLYVCMLVMLDMYVCMNVCMCVGIEARNARGVVISRLRGAGMQQKSSLGPSQCRGRKCERGQNFEAPH